MRTVWMIAALMFWRRRAGRRKIKKSEIELFSPEAQARIRAALGDLYEPEQAVMHEAPAPTEPIVNGPWVKGDLLGFLWPYNAPNLLYHKAGPKYTESHEAPPSDWG